MSDGALGPGRALNHTMSSKPLSKPTDSGSSTPSLPVDVELEKLLNREASAFQRELEVDRILKAFKLKYVFPLILLSGVE